LSRFLAIAAYRFKKEQNDELGFEPNTRIQVHVSVPGQEKSNLGGFYCNLIALQSYLDSDWWFGHLQSHPEKQGFFPKNYVRVDDETRHRFQLNI
jgi:hypothetical protein